MPSYIYNMVDTWNAGATTFTAIKMDVTDTASAAASLLMDLQVGGASAFNVSKAGSLKLGINSSGTNVAGTNVVIAGSQGTGTGAGGSIVFQVAPAGTTGTAQNALVDALTINSASQLIGAAGSVSAPTFAFTDTNYGVGQSGMFYAANGVAFGGAGGSYYLSISNQALTLSSGVPLAWSSGNGTPGSADTILARDDANTLALRNGGTSSATVPQTFNQYEYWASASDYSRISLSQSSAYFFLQTQAAGSGTKRGLILRGSGTNSASLALHADQLFFGTSVADYWTMSSSGHFLAGTDNIYDIGASGATRPRNVYVGTSITPGRGVTVAGLPTPSTGMIARVTDATAPVIGATVAGGGAAYALVNYNGANWTVIGV